MNESMPSKTQPPQAAKKPRRWFEVRGTLIIRQVLNRSRVTRCSQATWIDIVESIDRLFACISRTIRQTFFAELAPRKEPRTKSPGQRRFRPQSRLPRTQRRSLHPTRSSLLRRTLDCEHND